MLRRLLERHPKEYHLAALVVAVLALSVVWTGRSVAEESNTTTASSSGTSSTTTIETCSFDYSSWSDCQPDGKRYRTVKSVSPAGCVQSEAPKLNESCSYQAPQCGYTYTDWSPCQADGKQVRGLASKSPVGCQEYEKPVLSRSCTFTAPTTTVTSTTNTSSTTTSSTTSGTTSGTNQTTAPPQCGYTYDAWGACQPDSKRYRQLLSKGPAGCEEYVKPVLIQSCVYESTTTTSSSTSGTATTTSTGTSSSANTTVPNTTTTSTTSSSGTSSMTSNVTQPTETSVTPPFSFLNVSDGMAIRGDMDIRGSVQSATKVELYLVPLGSNTYKYLGSAIREDDARWRTVLRSEALPNGEYSLRAKVENAYGKYDGGQRRIMIANGDKTLVTATSPDTGFQPIGMTDEEKKKIIDQFKAEIRVTDVALDPSPTATVEEERRRILNFCLNSPAQCQTEKDTDGDGLHDVDEIRYGSNPTVADSDLDGFIDGDEVKHGFDPVKYSSGDKSDRIVFESPKTAGEVRTDVYAVKKVELTSGGDGKKKLRLEGKGLPNSFVTIYIYSDPIVLTVKTDSEGNWTYELDKEVEDGNHEVYVAVTDNTGKITAKSEALPFVKTAQAVSIVSPVDASPAPQAVSETRSTRDLLYLVAVSLSVLAAALALIGLIRHRHHRQSIDSPPSA